MPEATSTANTASTAIANTVVPESKPTIRRIGTAIGIAIAVAAAETFAQALPELSNAILTVVPYGAVLGPILAKAALYAQVYILAKAATYHKDSVITALNTEPPAEMAKYYTQ